MHMILDLICITVICCLAVDVARFPDSVKRGLSKWLKVPADRVKIKPFDCSVCSTWWCCALWLLVHGCFTLPWLASALCLACAAPLVSDLYMGVRELLQRLITKIR